MAYRTVILTLVVLISTCLVRPTVAFSFEKAHRPYSACVLISESLKLPESTIASDFPASPSKKRGVAEPSLTILGQSPKTPWDTRSPSGGNRPNWILDTKSLFKEGQAGSTARGNAISATAPSGVQRAFGTFPLPTRWLPRAPSVEVGGMYASTPDSRRSHMALDLFVPMRGNIQSTSFLQLHSQLPYLEYRGSGFPAQRSDVSLGLGFRSGTTDRSLYGMNVFVDATRIGGQLHGSGGLGFEYARQVSSKPKQVWDFAVNLYLGGGIEAETGYSSQLTPWLDGRVFLAKTRFFDGEYLLGWRGGVDLTGPHRLLGLRYEYGQDRINASSHTVMAFASLPLRLENLFQGKSPVVFPDTRSPQARFAADNLFEKVRRNWQQPESALTYRSREGGIWNAPGSTRFVDDESLTAWWFGLKKENGKKESGKKEDQDRGSRDGSSKELARQRDTTRRECPSAPCGGSIQDMTWVVVGAIGAAAAYVGTGVAMFAVEGPYRYVFGPFETEKKEPDKPRP